jgi:hypothetical protein
VVAPFNPRGTWPLVALDVDRHNAAQEFLFEQTLAELRSLFPGALFVRSSDSRGVHAYVRLPGGVDYTEAALILETFLTMRELRWTRVGPKKRPLLLNRVEVPQQPVRLPFGEGSWILGDTRPLAEQIRTLEAHALGGSTRDFTDARAFVSEQLKLKGGWSFAKRNKLQRFVVDAALAGVPSAALAARDPWAFLLPKLSAPSRKVAAFGVPAYGTRTHWTNELLGELVRLLPRDDVERLMGFWLRERDHVSEDIEVDLPGIERFLKQQIDAQYRRSTAGVPKRLWCEIESWVRHSFRMAQTHPQSFPRPVQPPQFSVEDALNTAFELAREFFAKRRQRRAVPRAEFARFVGKNDAANMESVLTLIEKNAFGGERGWLKFAGTAGTGYARRYAILPIAWPARPHEAHLLARP